MQIIIQVLVLYLFSDWNLITFSCVWSSQVCSMMAVNGMLDDRWKWENFACFIISAWCVVCRYNRVVALREGCINYCKYVPGTGNIWWKKESQGRKNKNIYHCSSFKRKHSSLLQFSISEISLTAPEPRTNSKYIHI